jgi:UDP-N-acetylenolpyruvoylglucosamine reductase
MIRSSLELCQELGRRLRPESVLVAEEPMAPRTTLRVGGVADCFVEPADEADLARVLEFCRERQVPFFVLGRGSNLLVRQGGVRGVVIGLGRECFGSVEVDGERLQCGAGARLKLVATEARRAGLGGLEFMEGIPGSVGGALRMNAGAMGSWVFEVVESVRLMDREGRVIERARAEIEVGYRECRLLRDHVALGATFRGRRDALERIQERSQEFNRRRWASQPAAPSAGCIFKNPAGDAAGRLIDEVGLKGLRVGSAVVSEAHGNFIVNEGGATADDVLELIELIRSRVREVRGIELETEVEIVGEAAVARGEGA